MPLGKFNFKPGVNKEGTEYSAGFGWFDSDKVRFRKGRPEKIGGWRKFSSNAFLGVCRSIHDWASLDFNKYLGVGTHLKLYAVEGVGFNDITPIRATTTAGDVTFAATDGSSTITATDTSHGATQYDFVTFSDSETLGGLVTAAVLNQEYQIATVPTANTYTFAAKDTNGDAVTANSSDGNDGGTAVVGAYQITTGTNTYVDGTGWGANAWDDGTFGSHSSIASGNQLRLWSQDNFGEDLVANARGGGVYYWDSSGGVSVRGVNLSSLSGASNTPEVVLQIMVSAVGQHVICFGVNTIGSSAIDPLLVRWSDSESAADWTPTAINTAGGVRINQGSQIIGALQTRQEILIWTDVSVHSMRFIGSPFIFQFSVLSHNISMISPKAAANARGNVYFMDRGGFFLYNGAVQPVPCSVKDHVFSNINLGQAYKVYAATNVDFSEVTWYYPVGDGDTDITNYVTFNYAENLWSVGTLVRGAWIEAGTRDYPLAASVITSDDNNYLYRHETGYDDDGSAMTAYIESGDVEMDEGGRIMFISRMIPDFRFSGDTDSASVDITLKGKRFPLGSLSTLATATVTSSTEQNFLRTRARESVVRVESSGLGFGWRLGDLRFEMRQDGKR
tara:strand:+ start:307 stop:2160 length:1854 start_codon:yes stop_codon:yes gene_type:complete